MKLRNAAIGKLSRMICGDEPYQDFPYRTSSNLTLFFEELDLDYVHDGSTRYWWVRSVLQQLNEAGDEDGPFPSRDLARAIQHLADPDHFADGRWDQAVAVERLNELLRRYELRIELNPRTQAPKLKASSQEFVSTAAPQPEPSRTISFVPSVFKVPEASPSDDIVAVMMPFAAEFDAVHEAIRGACEKVGFRCYRADDIWEDSTFIQDIFDLIFVAAIVVVDFTGKNPNVLYETGISHTLGKHLVPLTQNMDHIPSDLRAHRALRYLANKEGLDELQNRLADRLKTLKARMDGKASVV